LLSVPWSRSSTMPSGSYSNPFPPLGCARRPNFSELGMNLSSIKGFNKKNIHIINDIGQYLFIGPYD